MERIVKFEVCGQEYSLNTDAPQQEVDEILSLVKTQMEQHSRSSTLLPAKLAVLVSLNMAGKYVKLKKEYERHRRLVDEKINKLQERIDQALDENAS